MRHAGHPSWKSATYGLEARSLRAVEKIIMVN
jgi:hypothetical protein